MPFPIRPSVLRNTCTLAAILGFGMVTGALLAETSLLALKLPNLNPFHPHTRNLDAVNDYLRPASNALQTSRRSSARPTLQGHHAGS